MGRVTSVLLGTVVLFSAPPSALSAPPRSILDSVEVHLGDRTLVLATYDAKLKFSERKRGRSVTVTDSTDGRPIKLDRKKLEDLLRMSDHRQSIYDEGLFFMGVDGGTIHVSHRPISGIFIQPREPESDGNVINGSRVLPPADRGRYLEGHKNHVQGVAFSADGRLLVSGAWDGTVRIWEVETRREIHRLDLVGQVFAVAMSPDGTLIASGSSGGRAKLWNARDGQALQQFRVSGDVNALAFSSDGKLLAGGGSNPANLAFGVRLEVHVWEVDTGEARIFEPPMEIVKCLEFSRDGRYLLCAGAYYTNSDRPIRAVAVVWDLKSGKTVFSLEPERTTGLSQASLSPDGRSILMRDFRPHRGLVVMDVRTGQPKQRIPLLDLPQMAIYMPYGRHALALNPAPGMERSPAAMELWDLEEGRAIEKFTGPVEHMNCMALSADGRYVAAGGMGGSLWLRALPGQDKRDRDAPILVQEFKHEKAVYAAVFSPDGSRVLSGGYDRSVRIWDVKTGRELHKFQGTGGRHVVRGLAFSSDGRYALFGGGRQPDDRNLTLWDIDAWREVRRLPAHVHPIRCVAFSPDGRYALSGDDRGEVRYWDVADGRELSHYKPPTRPARCVAFSPNGRLAVYTGGNIQPVRIWKVENGRETCLLEGHDQPVYTTAFSPDGKTVLTGSQDGTIRQWDRKTGEQLRSLLIPRETTSVAFSPDGRLALSGGHWGTLHLWDIARGEELAAWEGHAERVTCTAFGPKGRQVLSAGYDGMVRVWRVADNTDEQRQRQPA